MKSMRKMLVGSCLLAAIIAANAKAQLGFEVTADYNGKYVWRGQNLDDEAVFQPGISVAYEGLTAGIWGSLELTDENGHSGEFTEVDYYVDYSAAVPGTEKLGFSLGAVYYDFPNTDFEGTTELYWGFSYDCFLSPSITFNHDVDEVEGMYVSAGIGHTIEEIFEVGEDVPVALDLAASLGWGDSSYNDVYWGVDDSAFNDLTLSAALPFEIAGWGISPTVNYVLLVGDDIKDAAADDDVFYFGIGLSKSF